MSVIHGNWSVGDIRKVIQSLDEKTGLNGASIPIYLYKSLGEGNTLGTYRPGSGEDKRWRCFSFSLGYFNNDKFEDLAVIDTIRHEYSHHVVDELGLKDVFEDNESHGIAWKTVCGLLNTDQDGYYRWWRFRSTTEEGLRKAIMSEDIPSVDIVTQLERWGNDLPSLRTRKYYEKELVKKYSRVRVFSVNDRVNHNKFGQGLVLDTMPDINKQRLLVKFDSGEIRFVQNRQVYKVVNGHVKKPVSKAR